MKSGSSIADPNSPISVSVEFHKKQIPVPERLGDLGTVRAQREYLLKYVTEKLKNVFLKFA